ncbi:unnamed protein product [Allacma fusca]|uniref:Diacylglycerol O-acyltransferase n=1 Tax=Allacma fusca TaxID=39272 RepID=A0A8J2P3I0_9HEXA|nr:unnamed protein product [Allacma fusca]
MVSARSSILSLDNMKKPKCNVVIWFVLETQVSVVEFQEFFQENVLNLRLPSQDLTYPEFRQYFHQTMGYLFWKWDENFHVQNHIDICDEFKTQSGPVLESTVLKLNEKLLSQPWPDQRSPWKFLLINNYERGQFPKTLVLLVLHHGMGDGYSFLKLIQNHLVGDIYKGKTAKPKMGIASPGKDIWGSLVLPFKIAYEFSEQALSYDFNEWHRSGWKLTGEVKVARTKRIPIAFVKQLKTKFGVSFSAILSAAAAGGIRKYFLDHGILLPESMRVFLPLPFPNHPDDKLVTHLTGCYYKLPVGEPFPQKRVEAAHRNFESFRGSSIPLVNFYLALIGGALPSCMFALNKNYHCTGIFSNFPGDEETQIFMMNRKIEEFSYNVGYLHGATGLQIIF